MTRRTRAIVDLQITLRSRISGPTITHISGNQIDASAVRARIRTTHRASYLTSLSSYACRTKTREKRHDLLRHTCTVVEARVYAAGDVRVAVYARIRIQTGAA